MVGKPFSIQAPEAIAKEYGGNKQKIAQAVQGGMLDPTAGVLAGMFIDRMRSAQMQEQGAAPTVAQQVLAPPMAPAPQMGAPGMGAPAPGMGAPAPQMGAPGMAMGGYAMGGLDDLPIPDAMFDEPTNGGFNDGYGGGGMVAFARGDYVPPRVTSRAPAWPFGSIETNDTQDDPYWAPFRSVEREEGAGGRTIYVVDGQYVNDRGFGVSPPGPGDTVIEGETTSSLWGPSVVPKTEEAPHRREQGPTPRAAPMTDLQRQQAAAKQDHLLIPMASSIGSGVGNVMEAIGSGVGDFFNAKGTVERGILAERAAQGASRTATPAPRPATPPPPGSGVDRFRTALRDPAAASAVTRAPAPTGAPPASRGAPRAGLAALVSTPPAAATPPAATPPNGLGTAQERMDSAMGTGLEYADKYLPTPKREALSLAEAEANKVRDPAERKRRKDEDKWMALAQIGFGMAASNSPYFLQAVGASAAAALPGIKEDKKAREALERDALKQLADAENIRYQDAKDRVTAAREYGNAKLGLENAEMARLAQERQFEQTLGLQREEMQSRERMSQAQINATLRAAVIGAGVNRSTDAERAARAYAASLYTPGMSVKQQAENLYNGYINYVGSRGGSGGASPVPNIDPPNERPNIGAGGGGRPSLASFGGD